MGRACAEGGASEVVGLGIALLEGGASDCCVENVVFLVVLSVDSAMLVHGVIIISYLS